ncbi:MAG TPA: FtsX-like permease family protein [Pseudolabrys sp.]|nr:FtsX-like permease family protein [Pseudolabrys sp.]
MSLLDRKLRRDLVALRGQVITIALVVASGVAVFIGSISTYNSLLSGRDRFYDSTRFPRIFVTLKRAPLAIVPRLTTIPGVATVEPRIVRDVIVDWPAAPLPVSARVVSLGHAGDEPLARLFMRRGTAPGPHDTRDAVVNEAFADTNGIKPGSDIRVILNGRLQRFTISGIALSPEFVYAVKPGLPIPDDRFFAVLWVDRSAAEAAFDMIGAFNDLAVSLAPGADPKSVVAELDRLLEPYGSVGAVERRDQPSNRFLEDELNEQKVMAITVPVIFFGVAALLLNVALGRQVAAQREQIAALKALGFPNAPLAIHYLKLGAVIVLLGSLLGLAGGIGFGHAMIASYRAFFRLPALDFELTSWSVMAGAVISFAAASAGVLTAVQTVVRLTPAVAMHPAPPLPFRRFWLERLLPRMLPPSRTMIVRNLAGRPVRAALTTLGIAFAVPIVVLGLFWRDAIDHMIEIQFRLVERGNTAVTFPHPLDRNIIGDLRREPGVLAAEGQRIVPVRLRAAHRSYLTSVIGLRQGSELRRPHDSSLRPIEVAPEGITLTRRLAERLAVLAGDTMTIEVMEGKRRKRDVPVNAIVDEVIGMTAYMDIGALNRLTGEGDVVSAAALFVEPSALDRLLARFKELPVIESVAMKAYTLRSFLEKIADLVLITSGILTIFAVIIAVGIVYNSARIGLYERARELASLRVLGFSRAEVSRIFFSEFMVEVVIAIPVGIALSQAIIDLIAHVHPSESFQIPGVIGARTFIAACAIVIAAAAGSAYVVRRRIDRLDLVAVLKARD